MHKKGVLKHNQTQGLLQIKREPPSEIELSPGLKKLHSIQVSYSHPEASLAPQNKLHKVIKHHQSKLKLSNFFRLKANESGVIYKPDSLYCRMERLSKRLESKIDKQSTEGNFEKTHDAIVNNLARVFERQQKFEHFSKRRARSAHISSSQLRVDQSDSDLHHHANNSLLLSNTALHKSTKGIIIVKPKVDLVKSFIMDLKTAALLRDSDSSSKRYRRSDSP